MKIYCGIGSREVPIDIVDKMVLIGEHMARNNWLLRSGGANGSDIAFESGCDKVKGSKEIFLPWQSFNNSKSPLYTPSKDAFLLAAQIHPVWDKLSNGAKKLHARNMHQVLGHNLKEPANLVICWTRDGKEIGGTATALRLSQRYSIKIVNLAIQEFDFNSVL